MKLKNTLYTDSNSPRKLLQADPWISFFTYTDTSEGQKGHTNARNRLTRYGEDDG